ncbi:hypothetical protein CVT25_006367 [Psilocybe cyanescens]|uniref:Uncharacterized protein n=1 Tax=Psilocybe cyanescens TaxID=93625 RepID=A0A409XKI4_PSICY|nr:hypothetical protein CVT25_006367 [Psilocybe cyanescens]
MRTQYDDNDNGSVYDDNNTGTRWNEGRGCKQVTRRHERGRNTRPMAYAYVPHVLRHMQCVRYDNARRDDNNNTQDTYHDTYNTHSSHDNDTEYATDVRHPQRLQRQ